MSHYRISTDRDVNGNHIVRIHPENGRTFSIQTNRNLPQIHGESIPHPAEPTYRQGQEIEAYIQRHGTEGQRMAVECGAKRYAPIDADDPDAEKKRAEQWDEAEKDAKDGKVINLSDLMCNA